MKTFIFSAGLFFTAFAAQAQTIPQNPAPAAGVPAQNVKQKPQAFLGVITLAAGDAQVVQYVFPNGPAAKAGVEAGTVIFRIDGKPVKGKPEVVSDILQGKKPGDEVEVWWWDQGDRVSRIALGSRDEAEAHFAHINRTIEDAKEHSRELAGAPLLPEGGFRHFRFTPPLLPGYVDPAKKQLMDIAPEVELDPYKAAGKRAAVLEDVPAIDAKPLTLKEQSAASEDVPDLRETKPWSALRKQSNDEDEAKWAEVQKRIAAVLDEAAVEAGMKDKVMKALNDARREEAERRIIEIEKKRAEIEKLEKDAREALERARKLRDELHESGE